MGVVRWVLRVVGVLAVVVGLAVLVVGRDGVLWSPAVQHGAPAGQPVTTSPAITAYSGATVAVEATVGAGEVQVATAHPVDVANWLDGVTHHQITAVGPGGLTTREVTREEQVPPVPAASAPIWSTVTSGAARQVLRLPLDGTPVQVVVATSDTEDVALRVGLVLPGLRLWAGGALLCGALLIAGSFLVRRRSDSVPGEGEVVASRGVLVAVLMLPLLGGCGALPECVDGWTLGEVTKTALTPDEAPALFADYDRRNNAAIVATAKSGDPKAWASADTEVVLDFDQFSTHLRKFRKDTKAAGAITHTADQVWAPEFTGYPMYAFTSSAVEVKGEKTSDPERRSVGLWLRTSATAPWLLAGSAGTTGTLPAPVPQATSSTPTAEDRKLAVGGAEAIMAYLRTAKPGKVTADQWLSQLATGQGSGGGPGNSVTVTWWRGGDDDQGAEAGSVRAVRVDGGIMAHASLTGKQSFSAGKGAVVSWNEAWYAKALGQPGKRSVLSRDIGVSVFYLVTPDGAVRVLASNWGEVR